MPIAVIRPDIIAIAVLEPYLMDGDINCSVVLLKLTILLVNFYFTTLSF